MEGDIVDHMLGSSCKFMCEHTSSIVWAAIARDSIALLSAHLPLQLYELDSHLQHNPDAPALHFLLSNKL